MLLLLVVISAAPHPLGSALPGPDTPSTAWVLDRLTHWKAAPALDASPHAAPVALECLQSAAEPGTVGVGQVMSIAAPVDRVAAIVEDFVHYPELFPDLVDVHKVPGPEDGNRFGVAWVQRVPIFFIPDVRYETTWLVDRGQPGRLSYRYKLKAPGTVRATDGLIVLEAQGATQTRYTEYDFVDADWGPVPEASVWELTLSNIFRSDAALKLRAEHPDWTAVKVREERERLFERFPTQGCFERRRVRAP